MGPWQRLFGGGRDECLMRLIDSGSGIGHGYDAVTNLAPQSIAVFARIATPVGPSAERDGGTVGNVDRVRAEEQGSTARHSRPGLGVGVDRGNKQTKHVCMRVCVQLRLARVRSQNCVGIKT